MLVAFADELQSGVPVVGAPDLSADLGLGSGFYLSGALLAAPLVLLAAALGVARAEIPPLVEEDEPDEPLAHALRGALADRTLLLAACALSALGLVGFMAWRASGDIVKA